MCVWPLRLQICEIFFVKRTNLPKNGRFDESWYIYMLYANNNCFTDADAHSLGSGGREGGGLTGEKGIIINKICHYKKIQRQK